ncbi:hypothetical protein Q8F55_001382 [Vanrija albida]|uniref:CP-type G domain-containing protein n=1 Tax=Vanrija albida TaxID=181172 RepID=A0ABR3QG26_9TREE
MAPNRTKVSKAGLGKALINRKHKEAIAPQESQLYTLDDSNPLASVTHERDLDSFLANAALADADFTTERSKMRIVAGPGMPAAAINPYLLSATETKKVAKKQYDMRHGLKVPRRPAWTRTMTRQQLEQQERDSFLDWRRDLAHLAEDTSLLLTPFERNIQLWRQLWRVLERSHLIVQIVDARNPLNFRSADLEAYVKEVGDETTGDDVTVPGKGKRKALLLINKADLLTYDQRSVWADYFEEHGITYAFFSAANAAALQEQAEKQRRREEGLDDEDDEDDEDDDDDDDEDDEVDHDDEELDLEEDDEIDEDVEEEADKQADEVVKQFEETNLDDQEPAELEDIRTRVLSVTELEDLFINSAPPLSDFATTRDPNPTKLMVGLVGYPNVGKSSTINALIGSKKVSVSATPGKTKHFQTLVLSDEITLCDCPGLVFPQFANTQADMICDGVLPIDQMREYSAPVELVCQRIPRAILEGTYGIRIDVKDVEDGGTGKVGWEDLLSAYAIARGMTRASFGMPDTSRASRYVLKDYVNAKLLYARAPPGIDEEEYMATSREQTLAALEEEYANGRKRAPETHVSKNADTYVAPAASGPAPGDEYDEFEGEEGVGEEGVDVDGAEGSIAAAGTSTAPANDRELQGRLPTVRATKATAASAPARTGKQRAAALENAFFTESGPAPRPVVKGRSQGAAVETESGGTGGAGFSRSTMYPHQRRLGPDGRPLLEPVIGTNERNNSKKHFKEKKGKQRSGRGYD